MNPIRALGFSFFLLGLGPVALPAQATDTATPEQTAVPADDATAVEPVAEPEGLPRYDAADVMLSDFLWTKRLLVVLADSPADPAFDRQIRYILDREEAMIERDIVLITDADPAARSDARTRLRPRGFMLAIIDKDGEVKVRRPSPRDGREITQAIDKFPLRREEMLERNPSGR
jgi:hypothetical protein